MIFYPSNNERDLIKLIQKYSRNEFHCLRLTETMTRKSTIDASIPIRKIFKDADIDYNNMERGVKYYIETDVIYNNEVKKVKTSLYHPKAKSDKKNYGDPRFWLYGLSKYVESNESLYITTLNHQVVIIILNEFSCFEDILLSYFGDSNDSIVLNRLLADVSKIRNRGWIESVNPRRRSGSSLKSAPKDAGETFEKLLGISPNSSKNADYFDEIELKCRRAKTKTNNTLFSKVPNWDDSVIRSSRDMILKYGYLANKEKYFGFKDLYVTVSNEPNNQGLYLVADDLREQIIQFHTDGNVACETCVWNYNDVKEAFYLKHKRTLWIDVEEAVIEGSIHFKYTKCELSQEPIFTQFTSLINEGIVKFDWRGRVRLNGKNYKDKGHAFRISAQKKHLLFGESVLIDFNGY